MGYTHYWTFNKGKRGTAAETEAAYQQAMLDCAKIVRHYYEREGGISGYTAHTKPGTYGGLNFNGKSEDGHETFIMREHYNQNDRSSFCKTARKPYDILVTACLAVLAYRLGDAISVYSDGDDSDWHDGVNLAQTVLRRKVTVPATIKQVKAKGEIAV
jgi:hypothetical protein